MSGSKHASPRRWVRPPTRGELRDRLARGETCEVATSNATITTMLLRGVLEFNTFTVRPSLNDGWSLFEPNATHELLPKDGSGKDR